MNKCFGFLAATLVFGSANIFSISDNVLNFGKAVLNHPATPAVLAGATVFGANKLGYNNVAMTGKKALIFTGMMQTGWKANSANVYNVGAYSISDYALRYVSETTAAQWIFNQLSKVDFIGLTAEEKNKLNETLIFALSGKVATLADKKRLSVLGQENNSSEVSGLKSQIKRLQAKVSELMRPDISTPKIEMPTDII